MNLSKEELLIEQHKLDDTVKIIKDQILTLGNQVCKEEKTALEFKKFILDQKTGMDLAELSVLNASSDLEAYYINANYKRLINLYKVQGNPYFGSIIFEHNNNKELIYIGITNVNQKLDYYVHDWRSPICSLFYDYEIGKASYNSPGGIVNGYLARKRQYNIKNGKFIRIFDNSINIDDELLQEVLANESDDKMKNIVNTIQQEQNLVIRNTIDQVLVVSGIAGSGKTSVALHRVAFLLYKIPNLTSKDVLIFSPNKMFTEYISNVLPELGEANTLDTTYNNFIRNYLEGYPNIESFSSFVANYYKGLIPNNNLIKYKLSKEIISDLNKYMDHLIENTKFIHNLILDDIYEYSISDLNDMFQKRYSKFPLFERIKLIATKIGEKDFNSNKTKIKSIEKKLISCLNIKKDYQKIYLDFFNSPYAKYKNNQYPVNFKKYINYPDSALYLYLKCYLDGFPYDNTIKHIVIDEAQDYNYLQYLILSKIFKVSSFTILGDVNQTINPYYKYDTLEEVSEIFAGKSKYLTLYKTYRSSEKIINYINKILDLNHITAIRRDNNKDVIIRTEGNLKQQLCQDLETIKKDSRSIAIITKNDSEATMIHNLLKDQYPELELLNDSSVKFNRSLVVVPSYISKGLEFDSVIIYTDKNNAYTDNEKHLFYVACSRAQHQLIVYNN